VAFQRAKEAGHNIERGVLGSVRRQRVEGRCLDGWRRLSGAGWWGGRRSDVGEGGSGAEGGGDVKGGDSGFVLNFLRSTERRNGCMG
jgi:hypothetical protein